MLIIDGSHGEGGGQIIRSSLAMSLVTGTPLRIHKIRAGRKQPGLMRQHLAAVEAATTICGARVEGATIGSKELTFAPGEVVPGTYHFRVGTAGSTSLVLQAILPSLLIAAGPSSLTLEGGTHNPWAPPFDFLERVFIPLVCRLGPELHAQLKRPGFYPAGGGSMSLRITPRPEWARFDLLQRGPVLGRTVRAITSGLPSHIAQRENKRIADKTDWPESCFEVEEVSDPKGPGNVLLIEIRSEHVTEVFSGFGRLGVKAERVADQTLKAANAYIDAEVPVGPYLADQLMLLLAVSAHLGGGGGSYRTMALTEHARTHIQLIKQFLDVRIDVQQESRDKTLLHIGPLGD